MKAPEIKPEVQLSGEDGNAFSIIGTVMKALRRAGADEEYVDKYKKEAMSGDYDNVLTTSMEYVEVH